MAKECVRFIMLELIISVLMYNLFVGVAIVIASDDVAWCRENLKHPEIKFIWASEYEQRYPFQSLVIHSKRA